METLKIITKLEELEELKQYLSAFDVVAFDTETTGLDESAEIIGLSVCAETDVAYYVILQEWNKETQALIKYETIDNIKQFCNLLKSKKLVMHNAVFDCSMVQRCYNVDLMPSLCVDTLILAHLIDENQFLGLKDLGAKFFGQSAKEEYNELSKSIIENGGIARINKKSNNMEMYKADAQILAKYGAKDALLTFNLMAVLLDELAKDDKLWKFFFDDECMPLLRGPTYQMNTAGLKIDVERLKKLEADLKFEILKLEERIYSGIYEYVKDIYPGTTKKNTFNINSPSQFSWLLFVRLGQEFKKLTPAGRKLAKDLCGKLPYTMAAKRDFIKKVLATGKNPAKYIAADKAALSQLKDKYTWVQDFLDYKRLDKMMTTYVHGIQERINYGIIRPSFLQHGTTSGRYSSKNPNFQNQPRDDKRIKECVIARPGKVFVGADYSQLEPRVFAFYSKDIALMKCFETKEDFYSVIGARVYKKEGLSLHKEDPGSFANLYKNLRQNAKTIGLSATYGTTAFKMVDAVTTESGKRMTIEECQTIIDEYFEAFPSVYKFMTDTHQKVVKTGQVENLYGRPRRIPDAMQLQRYGRFVHGNLPYNLRNLLNLAVNHTIQSTAASIVNRSAISLSNKLQENKINAKIVLQVHDSLVVECEESQAQQVADIMKECMENTCKLDGVALEAEPKIGKNLAEV